MAKSHLYPDAAHSITKMAHHPKFIMRMRAAMTDANNQENPLYYALAELQTRVEADPDRYVNGIPMLDFITEFPSAKTGDDVMEELRRMNIYRLVQTDVGPRLAPCTQIESATVERTKMERVSYYVPAIVAAGVRAEARKRERSASDIATRALAAYIGGDDAS